jgi:hypothetical protein
VTQLYLSDDNGDMPLNFTDYLITPRDAVVWIRTLRRRDYLGILVMAAAALLVGLWLQDVSAALFAAGMTGAIWWRVDSRWAFGTAIVLLVLIPLMQFAYNINWLFSGATIASGLAVAVWYLMAIGVVRQIIELRHMPSPAPVLIAQAQNEAVIGAVSSINAPELKTVPVPSQTPAKPTLVPAWRRRLDALERESGSTARKSTAVDGVRSKRQ